MRFWNAVLRFSSRRPLPLLVIAVVAVAGFGVATVEPLGRTTATPAPATITPTATAAPLPVVSQGAPLAGVYTFRSADEQTPDYLIDLRPDGMAFVQERPVGALAISAAGTGTWSLDQGDAVVTVQSLAGEVLAPPETLRLKFTDGFPTGAEARAGGVFERLPLGTFSLGAGEEHPLVQVLHKRLAALPWLHFTDPGTAVFGEETRQALAEFQGAQDLDPTGVLDAATWLRLESPLPPPPQPPATPEPVGNELPARTETGKPILYLTFDDGPQPQNTQAVLDLLDKYKAKATFFVVGSMAAAYPATLADVAARGHVIGNHTWNHKSLKGMSFSRLQDQVSRTDEAIKLALADSARPEANRDYLRPPYGAMDRNTKRFAGRLAYRIMLWDLDPQDWRRPGTATIIRYVLKNARPGAVLLMHDGGGNRSQTIAALRTLLPTLKSQGYVFRALPPVR